MSREWTDFELPVELRPEGMKIHFVVSASKRKKGLVKPVPSLISLFGVRTALRMAETSQWESFSKAYLDTKPR